MGKTDKYEYDFLCLTFNGKPITNIAATAGTTSIWIGLHTADPGDAGSTASEGGYPEYIRLKTDRSTGASTGWAVTSGTSAAVASASPLANLDFPQSLTTSTGTFSYMSVNPSSDGSGSSALYTGTVSPVINFGQNVIPRITTGSSITED